MSDLVYCFGEKTFEALSDIEGDWAEKDMLPVEDFPQYGKLKGLLAEIKESMPAKKINSEKIKLSDEKKEQLKALGYIN